MHVLPLDGDGAAIPLQARLDVEEPPAPEHHSLIGDDGLMDPVQHEVIPGVMQRQILIMKRTVPNVRKIPEIKLKPMRL